MSSNRSGNYLLFINRYIRIEHKLTKKLLSPIKHQRIDPCNPPGRPSTVALFSSEVRKYVSHSRLASERKKLKKKTVQFFGGKSCTYQIVL